MRSTLLPLLSAALLISSVELHAQDCSIPFTTPLFDVQVESNIFYGTATRYNGASDSLRLNLFKPVGDGQVERPLLICIHGGGFNTGTRNELNSLCQDFASMGWAVATISYRLDFYGTWLLGSPWAYDAAEVIRAAYRAQQDARGALRYLKARSGQDSTSTENVIYMGFSAGAITALHAAYVDQPSEKPASCEAIGNVVHGANNYPRPDLGPIEGTLNMNGMSDDVLAVASYFGGFLDTALIASPLDPALYMYHQTGDPVVGCGHQQGLWGMPLGVGANYPWLYGSCVTNDHLTAQGVDPTRYLYNEYVGNTHGIHDPTAVYLETTTFLRSLFCGVQTGVEAISHLEWIVGPVPSNGLIRITGPSERTITGLTVLDHSGRVVRMVNGMHTTSLSVDLSDQPDGVYLLRIVGDEGVHTERVVLAR